MKTALTIAGSDSSGGAGIQADIKTMTANGVFATCAVTALTAQNTTGVTDILESTPHFLAEQLDAVFTDIVPDAVKIGMVSSAELIAVIAEKLRQYGAERVVMDPVMVATSGAKLLRDDAIQALTSQLLPLATVLTPNIPEAEILSGLTITDAAGMEAAARTISQRYGCAVLCKGGHQINDAAYAIAAVLNHRDLKKQLGIEIDYTETYVKPGICSVLMGVAAFAAYKLLYLLLKSNTLALLLAILVGVVVYGALVLLTGTIRKEEIRKLPKGEKLLKLLDRFVK